MECLEETLILSSKQQLTAEWHVPNVHVNQYKMKYDFLCRASLEIRVNANKTLRFRISFPVIVRACFCIFCCNRGFQGNCHFLFPVLETNPRNDRPALLRQKEWWTRGSRRNGQRFCSCGSRPQFVFLNWRKHAWERVSQNTDRNHNIGIGTTSI